MPTEKTMESRVSFSIHTATKRKRPRSGLPTASDNGFITAKEAALSGAFLSAEDAAREAIEAAARDERLERPLKKTMLLEDERAKVKRLQAEGNTLAEAGRFRAAMDRWHEAIAIDPTDAVLYELMAQASMAVGDDFEAIQFGLKAVERRPAWGDAFHTLARCHLNFGELELALDNVKKAEELVGQNEEIASDRREIQKLLDEQQEILKRRDMEAEGIVDADKLEVLSCMKHLSLRGRVG